MTHPQKVPTLFNKEIKNFSKTIEELTYNDIVRTLFFTRIAGIQLRYLSRSQVLNDSTKGIIYNTLDALRRYDHKMMSNIGEHKEKILCRELRKDKVYDMAGLLEGMMLLSDTDYSQGMYEEHLALITKWIDSVGRLQKKGKKVNTAKYKALVKFMLEEMKAESEGGETSVTYNQETNELNFRLVQPNSNVPVQPTLTK